MSSWEWIFTLQLQKSIHFCFYDQLIQSLCFHICNLTSCYSSIASLFTSLNAWCSSLYSSCSCGPMDAGEEGVVRAVTVGSSVEVTMEVSLEAAVVVVGLVPGQVEWHVGVEWWRSAAVWEVGEPGAWGEIFRERKKRVMEEGNKGRRQQNDRG